MSGWGAEGFVVAEIDENGADAGALAAVDVAPAVADHPGAGKVETEEHSGVGEHTGSGFAAVVFGVIDALAGGVAGFDVSDRRDELAEAGVHRFDDGLRLRAATDVGLVGDDDEHIAGGGEGGAGFGDARDEFELGERGGRVGLAVADDLSVQRAVAVEKDGGAGGWRQRRRGRGLG